jgi:hypothetical protein
MQLRWSVSVGSHLQTSSASVLHGFPHAEIKTIPTKLNIKAENLYILGDIAGGYIRFWLLSASKGNHLVA